MVRLIAAAMCISGTLSQYAPGVMERVIANRQAGRTAYHLPKPLPEVAGYIAVLSCRDVGQVWTLTYKGEPYQMLVTDCAGDKRARQWMTHGGVIAEVDHAFAKARGFVGRGVKAELCRPDS